MSHPNLKKLKKLRSDYKNERKGYRDRQYELLADTLAIVIELRSDEAAVKGFLKLSGQKNRPANAKGIEDWLTVAVVAYVTTAKSDSAIKLAWKRARVLDYLYDDQAVSPEKIPGEIRSRGGIETIVREAASKDPRRSKGEKGGAKRKVGQVAKKNPFKSAKIRKEKADDADEMDDWDPPIPDNNDDHDEGDHSRITVRISPTLRVGLMAIDTERRVKLIGVRIDSDDCLEIQEVRRLKK